MKLTEQQTKEANAQLASIHELVQALKNVQTDAYEEDERGAKEDEAREEIQQHALEVSTRSGWGFRDDWEAEDYKILLAFVGPSVRIRGKLDEGTPVTAQLEYQDWGTPWTRLPLTDKDIDALLTYAGCFYFGE